MLGRRRGTAAHCCDFVEHNVLDEGRFEDVGDGLPALLGALPENEYDDGGKSDREFRSSQRLFHRRLE